MTDYSYKNFAGHILTHLPASDFIGITIRGSCFSHETPDAIVFPDGSKDMTFEDCNIDNVLLPPNSTVIRGCARRFKAQADGTDWIVDAQNNPIGPL